jgi:hypothetical protein
MATECLTREVITRQLVVKITSLVPSGDDWIRLEGDLPAVVRVRLIATELGPSSLRIECRATAP